MGGWPPSQPPIFKPGRGAALERAATHPAKLGRNFCQSSAEISSHPFRQSSAVKFWQNLTAINFGGNVGGIFGWILVVKCWQNFHRKFWQNCGRWNLAEFSVEFRSLSFWRKFRRNGSAGFQPLNFGGILRESFAYRRVFWFSRIYFFEKIFYFSRIIR